jgi:hypothetical protein
MDMNDPTPSRRPKKRRRTKGFHVMVEDDFDAAEAISVRTVIKQTENGPVEEMLIR